MQKLHFQRCMTVFRMQNSAQNDVSAVCNLMIKVRPIGRKLSIWLFSGCMNYYCTHGDLGYKGLLKTAALKTCNFCIFFSQLSNS